VLCDLAIFGAYVAIALFLIDESFFLNVWRLGVMLAAVWWLTIQQAAFGYQVILNFFFPQLLGETIVFASLYVLSRDRFAKIRWSYQTAALVATVWMLGYVQPLAAVQLAICVVVFSVLSAFLEFRESKERPLTFFLKPFALSMLLMAAVIFQPAFMTMRAIALHDGYLRFGPWLSAQHYVYLVAFGIASTGMAIAGVLRGKLERRRGLMLASCALAAAALMVAQRLLFAYMNLGSEYAVGKHVFFLATISAATFSYASTLFIPGFPRRVADAAGDGRLVAVLPVLFSLSATYFVFSAATTWRQELPPILQYQSSLDAYRQYSLPVDAVENIASLNKNFTPIVNYLVSVGDLGLPMAIGNLVAESGASLDVPVKYAIVRDDPSDHDASERCTVARLASPPALVVDRSCFVEASSEMPANQTLRAGSGGQAAKYLTVGWDGGESWGTWSVVDAARIEFSVPRGTEPRHFGLRVAYMPFIAGARHRQSFTVVADGMRGDRYDVTNPGRNEFVAPLEGEGPHVVNIYFENPQSPLEIGVSQTDGRKLSIAVVELELLRR
jgi:hypothetical protein